MNSQSPRDDSDKVLFGFWVYILTDCVLFASLFAVYAVLFTHTFGGPGPGRLFSLPYALTETFILLTSSFTSGLAVLGSSNNSKRQVLISLAITFILGLAFLTMEVSEFSRLIASGNSWRRSGFLSAFFTLVGTHGLHITAGLIWMSVLSVQMVKNGLTSRTSRRLRMFSIFWHFLDIVWIFIFSLVYLIGVL